MLQRVLLPPMYPIAPCGFEQMAHQDTQHLSSPNSPFTYNTGQTCTWTLASRMGFCVQLKVLTFQTSRDDILSIQSIGVETIILSGLVSTNITLPIYCYPVYLSFVAGSAQPLIGFRIAYVQTISPTLTMLKLPDCKTPVPNSYYNQTLPMPFYERMETVLNGNMEISERLQYVQLQFNDRVEEYTWYLDQQVLRLDNLSQTIKHQTSNCDPFSLYPWLMLGLSSTSSVISLIFLMLTMCVTKRITALRLDPQLRPYHPGRYTMASLTMATLFPFGGTSASHFNGTRLLQYIEKDLSHGILIPHVTKRASEWFFQAMTLYLLTIVLICLVFIICCLALKKDRGESATISDTTATTKGLTDLPSAEITQGISERSKSKQLTYKLLTAILLINKNKVQALGALKEGTFWPKNTPLSPNVTLVPHDDWKSISFDRLWNQTGPDPVWTNPIPMYSSVFGCAVAEGKPSRRNTIPDPNIGRI